MRFLFFFLSTWMLLSFQTTTITAERSSNALTRKMNELCSSFRSSGFITFKHGDLSMERRTEFPIFVDLKEGRWYQF